MGFTLQRMIEALNTLTIGTVYKYASVERASTGACQLVSVDQHTGAIKYKRNRVGIAPEANAKTESITGANVAKLAAALSSGNAVEVNALYGGSGNFRSALEALVANTANVFVCQIDGKKHIFWNPDNAHPVGQVTVSSPPAIYAQIPFDDASCRLTLALKLFAEKRRIAAADGGWLEAGREVNGKVRATISIGRDDAKDEVLSKAKEAIAGKFPGNIVKEIYVPGKIVNIVIK